MPNYYSIISTTVPGAPTTGTWATGQQITDSSGVQWICSSGGTPGTWGQSAAYVSLLGPNSENPIGNLGAPWLQLVNSATDGATSSLHLTANAGYAGPYLLGLNAAPATNISQLISNVAAAGNKGMGAHLYLGDDATSIGMGTTADAGSLGVCLSLTSAGTGLMEYVYYSGAPAAGQSMIQWRSTGNNHNNFGTAFMNAYADNALVQFSSVTGVQVNGSPLAVTAATAGTTITPNVNMTYLSTDNATFARYAGAAGLWYSGQVSGSDTTAAALILKVSTGAAAIGSEVWVEGFRVQRTGASVAGISFFGGAVASKQAVTGALSTVTDPAVKAVLTSILAALATNYGLVTNSTT